ncbi:MAG: sialate O-acetylesterase [Phycisphaerales bacterium]
MPITARPVRRASTLSAPPAGRCAGYFVVCAAMIGAPVLADVTLPAVISDGMVLQQSSAVPIWGWADPGEQIAVTAGWLTQPVRTQAEADGSWRVSIQTPAASREATTLSVVGKNAITVKDILVGEVWVCSGQSNMEWPLAATEGSEQAINAANHPTIRLFTVQNSVAATPQRDCAGGKWNDCTPTTARDFSAVGYYFGSELNRELGVPIGLIASDWGGTPAESWTSRATISGFPEFADHLSRCDRIRDLEQARRRGEGISDDAAFAAWLKQIDEADIGSRDPAIDPRGGWFAENFDHSAWPSIDVPGHWSGDLSRFDGLVWMRTTFEAPALASDAKAVLSFGPIDDCDTVWINGQRVAQSMMVGVHDRPRAYNIPPGVIHPGRNTIAVRILDTGGPGGVTGDASANRLTVQSAGNATIIALGHPWKAMKGAAVSALPGRPQPLAPAPWTATNLYNGMIAPIAGYGIRGAIWYQGESNRERAFQYRSLFPAMITDWRSQWALAAGGRAGDKNMFPFYFVQIAPFNYGGDRGEAAELREAQTLTLSLPNTGMAVTMDIGNPADIHPRNKSDVGHRLALWALAKDYGRAGVEYSGPMYKSMRVQNNRVFLSFDHIGTGLDSGGESLRDFTIAGDDQKFLPAQATIEGDEVVVFSNEILHPVAVRYAWGAADVPNLKNKEGLPAPSFRTDDWPMLTRPADGGAPAKKSSSAPGLEDGRRLVLRAPIERWDEAIPLGNGLLGGLLWGKGNLINLSLDRGDLWDLRTPETLKRPDWTYDTMKRLVAAKDHQQLVELFDKPYDTVPYPTKLPGGRLVIHLDEGFAAERFSLDLRDAEARIDPGTAARAGAVRSFFSAVMPVGYVTYTGPKPRVEIIRPKGLDRLGYPAAQFEREGAATEERWLITMKQSTLGTGVSGRPLAYVVAAAVQHDPRTRRNTIVTTITSSDDSSDPLALARERLEQALAVGYDAAKIGHETWWRNFWSISSVRVADGAIQAHYDLCKYFYGSASRADGPTAGPPIPLQGVWTADEGGLPPWKGDFHNDLNTQMTYLACHAAGLEEAERCWLDFNMKLLPRYQRFAKEFYGVDGAVVPGVMTLTGDPMGGWGMYSLSPTNGAWVAQSFYLHWQYTQDRKYLEQQAFPFCLNIARGIRPLLEMAQSVVRYRLPLSSSPEIHDNSLRAWLTPNSNYDASLIRWLFSATSDLSIRSGEGVSHAMHWGLPVEFLEPPHLDSASALAFAKNEPYTESHRHFSHTMAIHPLMLLTIDGSADDQRIVNASIDRILEKGTSAWCGYSFSWMSCILATIGRPEQSLDYLEKYMRGFILRNGFHCNGDQSGTGLSNFTYRPFTLEGNFLAMQAVQDMLIQSWGGRLRIFPATSVKWPDASFTDLRAEGGFKVSAKREAGRTTSVSITATVDQTLRLRDPFTGLPAGSAAWNRDDLSHIEGDIFCKMKAGETVTGQIASR